MEVFGIGPMELLLVLIVALMVFGPDKLPEIGAKLGKGLRAVRTATHEFSKEIEATRQAVEAPLNEIKQPLAELTQPLKDIRQPIQDLKQPLEDLKHPFRELGQAVQQAPKQANNALAAAAESVSAAMVVRPEAGPAEPEPHEPVATAEDGQAGEVADFGAALAQPMPTRAKLAALATAVINPQEALREVIARQMRPGPGGQG
jgi:TatA/E family protein of Tat protein translocase